LHSFKPGVSITVEKVTDQLKILNSTYLPDPHIFPEFIFAFN